MQKSAERFLSQLYSDEKVETSISNALPKSKTFFNPYSEIYQGFGEGFDEPFERSKVNRGTFLPLKQQITQMIQSGVNLTAIRQAQYEFQGGISDDKLFEYQDETKECENKFDIDLLRKKYVVVLNRLKEAEKAKSLAKDEPSSATSSQSLGAESAVTMTSAPQAEKSPTA